MQKFLVIQTAFIGDVILATALLEKLHKQFPDAALDFLVRKGNESLLENHPYINHLLVWDKRNNKYKNLLKILKTIRARKYDQVINVQRFAATGFLSVFAGAAQTVGFNKNPWSRFFSKRITHEIHAEGNLHEVNRNQKLIAAITGEQAAKPRLYPSSTDYESVAAYKTSPYTCVAPASVWHTKMYPTEKWVSFINQLPAGINVYLIGSTADIDLCTSIKNATHHPSVHVLAGKFSLLQSAALLQSAVMNYVNDSGPLHLASAINAPVTAIYCSTVPSLGFGPLSDQRFIVETTVHLTCRPCGTHGHAKCPLGHFNCAHTIQDQQLLSKLSLPVN